MVMPWGEQVSVAVLSLQCIPGSLGNQTVGQLLEHASRSVSLEVDPSCGS